MVNKYSSRTGKARYVFPEIDHFLTSIAGSRWILSHLGQVWRPPTDVYETDDSIVVKVEVAGMAGDDFAITFAEHNLIIAGVRSDPSTKLGYHQMEIPYGEFRTEVYVSEAIVVDSIQASYEDGFLLVTLPKAGSHTITLDRA
jgi:HSP20 family protein